MDLWVVSMPVPRVEAQPVEIVERKGTGHPDTICDALAEEVSLALSRHYLERFGLVLHHNVDKVLLVGGRSAPAFGGGEVLEPIAVTIGGRATSEFRGVAVPVDAIARDACLAWLRAHLHALDVDRDVRITVAIRPGSAELVELFLRQREQGEWLANDTSCGVGYAPLSGVERAVLAAEQALNDATMRRAHPAAGEDVKVMGVRVGDTLALTVACAMIGRHLAGLREYQQAVSAVGARAQAAAEAASGRPVEVAVNTADDVPRGSVYLTVTGTSAEAGDDGEAGRGNRANGLATPMRPMTMESVAGKNAVTHVGKIYNLAAGRIADALVSSVPGVEAAECFLVSRIGRPIDEPWAAEVRLHGAAPAAVRAAAEQVVQAELALLPRYAEALVERRLRFGTWPFGSVGPAA